MSAAQSPAAPRFDGTDSYVATDDLKLAVNAALALERPLLITGEPGTGKTMLAEEVSRSLSGEGGGRRRHGGGSAAVAPGRQRPPLAALEVRHRERGGVRPHGPQPRSKKT